MQVWIQWEWEIIGPGWKRGDEGLKSRSHSSNGETVGTVHMVNRQMCREGK